MSRLPENLSPDLFAYRPYKRNPKLMPEGVSPDLCVLFERLALSVWQAGHRRYSADAILHRIRWFEQIERGNLEFKCNDHWTAPLARWFLAHHPDKKGFFALRKLKEERNGV